MSLQYIVGARGSGKSHWISTQASKGDLIICPSMMQARIYREHFATEATVKTPIETIFNNFDTVYVDEADAIPANVLQTLFVKSYYDDVFMTFTPFMIDLNNIHPLILHWHDANIVEWLPIPDVLDDTFSNRPLSDNYWAMEIKMQWRVDDGRNQK